MTPAGGSHGNQHPAARIHVRAWRRGSMAAYSACAADDKAADHRISGRKHSFYPEPMDSGICAAAARSRLDRRPLRGYRIALGGRKQRERGNDTIDELDSRGRLIPDIQQLTPEERDELVRLCDEARAT